MNEPLRIVVRGQPAPQGSKHARPARRKDGTLTGKVALVESSKEGVSTWRSDVKDAAIKAIKDYCPHGDRCYETFHPTPPSPFPLTGPVEVSMVFSFKRPQGHYGTGRNAHVLKANAPARPISGSGQGDYDKLARSTTDALTSAGAWHNDKQVAECRRVAKVWCGEDPDALDVPGAVITVRQLDAGG